MQTEHANHVNDVLGLSRNLEEPGVKSIFTELVFNLATLEFLAGYRIGPRKNDQISGQTGSGPDIRSVPSTTLTKFVFSTRFKGLVLVAVGFLRVLIKIKSIV